MSRVEGKMSRVEGKMSRVQKCRQHSGFETLVKKPEFLGRFCIIEQFIFLYTIEYFHAVSSIPKIRRHRSEEVYNAVAICLAAVSNRLKYSPNFPRKPFLNLMKLKTGVPKTRGRGAGYGIKNNEKIKIIKKTRNQKKLA